MLTRVLAGVTIFIVAASSPALGQSSNVEFVGQSRATAGLKRDIVAAITGYAKARHSCGTLATIETTPLKEGYEPKTEMYRVSAPQHFYERWVATLCGAKRPFLVALWPSPKGGADYKVVEVPPGTEP
jgi:hypothetical protein